MHNPVRERIWKIKVPNKIIGFLWLVRHGHVLCNVERSKSGLTINTDCPRCDGSAEDLNHMFRTYPRVQDVWKTFMPSDNNTELCPIPLMTGLTRTSALNA